MPQTNDASGNLSGPRLRLPSSEVLCESALLLAHILFFLFYGLTPWLGGNGIGLVGADEPRYAQIAHEMLDKLNAGHTFKDQLSACVTPYLYGHPWLEKPALYYWRAMLSFREFGVHDWSARVPSASFAFMLVALIYLHMRRFRPGGHLDAALITLACTGILSFARGASTDMQLAAPFSIALLGWYAWYETGSKFWLFDLYFFTGVATLAKGPVAPFLALVILCSFAILRREWSILRKSLWWPGVILYFAIVLPWFLAVQHKNPTFFREFFIEHNLERFATNRYQHEQPVWYYLMVGILVTMPWTILTIRAFADGILTSVAEWRMRHTSKTDIPLHGRPGDAFPEFLVLWALIPFIFFSFAKSKLPGYILPALPPLTILTGDYLYRARQRARGLGTGILAGHSILTGLMTTTVVLLPWLVAHAGVFPTASALALPLTLGIASAAFLYIAVRRFGFKYLRPATIFILAAMMFTLFGIGPFWFIPQVNATKKTIALIDRSYSARPLAQKLATMIPPDEPVAVYKVRRDMEYGLSFYRNYPVTNYEESGVPSGEHILVVRMTGRGGVDLGSPAALREWLRGRRIETLFPWPEQDLMVYRVGPQ